MAEVFRLKDRMHTKQVSTSPVSKALADLLKDHPNAVTGIIMVYDPDLDDMIVWASATGQEMAYMSLQLGAIALEQ